MSNLPLLIEADIVQAARDYTGERFHGILSDPPYALISIAKRFGKPGSAPAQKGRDGSFARISKGFMGQAWDSFESLDQYRDWVHTWAMWLIDKMLHPGAVCLFFGGTRTWHHLALGLELGGFEIYDTLMWLYSVGLPKSHKIADWEDFGTALKPAWEPIFVCRAPKGDRSHAQLAELYGTGGLDIGNTRVADGRWPANILLTHHDDCVQLDSTQVPARVLNRWAAGAHPFGGAGGLGLEYHSEQMGDENGMEIWERWACAPECAIRGLGPEYRYFYCGKANPKEKHKGLENFFWEVGFDDYVRISEDEWRCLPDEERAKGNIHPTVKPLDLLRYLAKLFKPPDIVKSRLLVPFSGSGSEVMAGHQAGWNEVVGVEIDPKYNEIAEARMAGTLGML